MNQDIFLLYVFTLANLVNILSGLMFLSRVHRPGWAVILGVLSLIAGIPAFGLAVLGRAGGLGVWLWIFPALYAVFALFTLFLDFILKIEFRQPRRPGILVPFLILFYVPLIAMWGMLWQLGLSYWAITGVTYFTMTGASFYALARGVG